jgi:DNA-binding NarL/FixJ family response regulator
VIDVLIADDHAVVRKGLAKIIADTADVQVMAEAGNGREVIELARSSAPDVVVLDLNMPDVSGFEALKQLCAEHPDLPVLVLSVHAEDQYAIRVLRAGAAGYLTKESAPERLVEALCRVAGGGRYMSSEVAEHLLDHLEGNADGPLHAQLSDREFQVMRFLALGNSGQETAEALSLSAKTVSTYRRRLLDKMGMKSDAEVIRYALEHELA